MTNQPLVVTFAAHYAPDLPDIGVDTVRLSDDVQGTVRDVPAPAAKSADPDIWNVVAQVVFGYVGDLGVALIAAWLYDRLKGQRDNDLEPHILVDQSVHIHNRTFINNIEVNTASREDIERAVRDALAGGPAPTGLPPQLAEPSETAVKPHGMSDEDWWVEQQLERGRLHQEEMQRLIRRSKDDD